MTPEKATEKAILDYLALCGIYAVKVHSGAMQKGHMGSEGEFRNYWIRLAPEGTPDILACIHGLFVGIEVKKDEKTKRQWMRQVARYKEQRRYNEASRRAIVQNEQHERIMEAQGMVLVCSSVEELQKDIDQLLATHAFFARGKRLKKEA